MGLYRRYMAQVVSAKMRTNLTQFTNAQVQEHSGELSFDEIITSGISKDRVVQHHAPRMILQAMMVFMLAGGILAASKMRLVDILPGTANTCTIWGQLNTWAGSRWCGERELQDSEGSTPAPMSKIELTSVSVSDIHKTGSTVYQPVLKLTWWTTKDSDGNLGRRYRLDVVPQS